MNIKSLICAALLACSQAFAASTTNLVDQWGVESEVGWGLSIQQQGDTLFINMFVQDANNQPTWYIAAVTPGVPAASGHMTFTGNLLKVPGTYYGKPWNQNDASLVTVGTIVFDVDSVTTANLSYTANGVTVNKRVVRELWKYEDYNGSYLGGIIQDITGCAYAGHREIGGYVTITQTNNTQMTMTTTQLDGGACSYAGTYSQLGHMGGFSGTYTCNDGTTGTFNAFEMEKTISGITGRFASQAQGCTVTGHFGGLRR
jgi:hypothetical protein